MEGNIEIVDDRDRDKLEISNPDQLRRTAALQPPTIALHLSPHHVDALSFNNQQKHKVYMGGSPTQELQQNV